MSLKAKSSSNAHSRTFILTAIVVVSCAVVTLFLPTNLRQPSFRVIGALTHDGASNCSLLSTAYTPSSMERDWLENAAAWTGDDFCTHTHQFDSQSVVWLAGVQAQESSSEVEHLDPLVFSSFKQEYQCGTSTVSRTSWIEPLSHGLRHPHAMCGSAGVVDRSYLLLAALGDTGHARGQRCLDRKCQNIMIDLGASTWLQGAGGPSQSWFESTYRQHGIEFDRYLMWEAKPIAATEVFKDVPPALLHKYQYFNVPAAADASNPASPLRVLKQIAQPGDFVVVKLDIDNYAVESEIVDTILADSELIALIDEFIYEEHVQFLPMLKYWGGTAHPNRTMDDSYKLFYSLRKNGIRAHSWV